MGERKLKIARENMKVRAYHKAVLLQHLELLSVDFEAVLEACISGEQSEEPDVGEFLQMLHQEK